MKKTFSYFLFALVFITACGPIVKAIYHIHQPRVMNEEKLTKYLTKTKLDLTNNVALSDKGYLETLHFIKMTYPEILVFDKDGKCIKYRDYKACNASAFKFIDSLKTGNSYTYIDSIDLGRLQKNVRDLKGKEINISNKSSDFTLLLFWTEWTGNLNKDHTLVWENKAKANKNCTIQIYKVNADFQEFWDPNERVKIIKYLSTKK